MKNINLQIKKGEKIGIIGLTGSGKSTILQLINKSYKISQGELNILGTNINEYTNEQIKSIVKLIEQNPNFYNTTIEENIKMGKNVPKKDIQKALKYSESYEFVQNLKEKENTKLENNANNLSGGQKQRISIARVFLKNPKILILDEATSALDNESEYLVSKSLERLAKGRTTLTIAHRLTTIQNADRILVLNENGIVEQGSHKELLDKKGVYHQLYMMANEIA